MIENVIGIDPGLDVAGLAWVSRSAGTITVREVCSVRTKPSLSMAERLHQISAGVSEWIRGCEVYGANWTVALEVPAHVGRSVKAKRAGGENVFAADMSKFWQSLGVIRAAVFAIPGVRLVELPPGGAKKEYRQQLYLRWTHAGRNADERDAIVTACTHLFSTAPLAAVAHLGAR